MGAKILVTGATGTVGTEVVKQLVATGVAVRAAVRSIEKAEETFQNPLIEFVEFDFEDPATLDAAFIGIEKLFLITPFTDDQMDTETMLVGAAKKHGIAHIVKLSAAGSEESPGIKLTRWHREAERKIEASGISYTFLRCVPFMQNFINYFPPEDDKIQMPLGNGTVSFIDVGDIARVALQVLTKQGHGGKIYTLTGPKALSIGEVAQTLSRISGRTISYVDLPEKEQQRAMVEMGMPEWMADTMMELHQFCKTGHSAAVTTTILELTGQKPTTFADFAEKHKHEIFHQHMHHA